MQTAKKMIKAVLQEWGYDVETPKAKGLIQRLAGDEHLQHHLNLGVKHIDKALKKETATFLRRSVLARLKAKQWNKPRGKITAMPAIEIRMRAPNLTAGKAFNEKIRLLEELPGYLELCNASGHESIAGLNVNLDDFSIEGTISTAGDYDLSLYAFQLMPNGERRRVKGLLKVTVNPDPRTLWKNLPSDASLRFHKPDSHADSAENEKVRLIGASVRGRSHAHKGTHRDDDFKLYCSPSAQWSVLCVADGAGSCKYSRRGAELASTVATKTLKETLNGHYGEALQRAYEDCEADDADTPKLRLQEAYRHTVVKAVYEAAKAIQEEMDEAQGDTFKDFSTTLLLAAHKPVDGGHLVLSFWVGDGAVVIYREARSVELMGAPDSGEFAGQTRFLDRKLFEDHSVYQRIKLAKVDDMTALILATDGVTDPWFETEKIMKNIEQWDALWQELKPFVSSENRAESEQKLLKWMDFWSPGNHDDRSIAICLNKG